MRAIVDSTGAIVKTIQTDEFGITLLTQGTSPEPFRYTGQQVDSDGLLYLRARYYDPTSGRFLSRDSFAGSAAAPLSLNRYTYARNNPTTLTDPSGVTPANKVLNRGSGDNHCAESASGTFGGDVVNTACTVFVGLGQMQDSIGLVSLRGRTYSPAPERFLTQV